MITSLVPPASARSARTRSRRGSGEPRSRSRHRRSLRLRLMISPTRSRTVLLAALERAQKAGPEARVHPHQFLTRVAPLLVAGLRLGAAGYRREIPPVVVWAL